MQTYLQWCKIRPEFMSFANRKKITHALLTETKSSTLNNSERSYPAKNGLKRLHVVNTEDKIMMCLLQL